MYRHIRLSYFLPVVLLGTGVAFLIAQASAINCNLERGIDTQLLQGKPAIKGFVLAWDTLEAPMLKEEGSGQIIRAVPHGHGVVFKVYAVADGHVDLATNCGAEWGGLIRIVHRLPGGQFCHSLYGGLLDRRVSVGGWVKAGQCIGFAQPIDSDGYPFHWEVREGERSSHWSPRKHVLQKQWDWIQSTR